MTIGGKSKQLFVSLISANISCSDSTVLLFYIILVINIHQ